MGSQMIDRDTQVLSKTSLLAGIEPDEIDRIIQMCGGFVRSFSPDEMVMLTGAQRVLTGVVLEGQVDVLTESMAGIRSILLSVSEGQTFGEVVNCIGKGVSPVAVIARADTRIQFLDLRKLLDRSSTELDDVSLRVIRNIIDMLSSKNVHLRQKVTVLSQRTIRARVAVFLLQLADAQGSHTVRLPFNRAELAEYLCVNRSALSRELGSMRDEGLIEFTRSTITIKDRMQLEEDQ